MSPMANRFETMISIIIFFTLLVDIYAYAALHSLVKSQGPALRHAVTIVFWLLTTLFIVVFLFFFRIDYQQRNPSDLSGMFILIGLYLLVYMPKIIFVAFRLTEDMIWLLSQLIRLLSRLFTENPMQALRLNLLSKGGLLLGFLTFLSILYGMVARFNYHVEKVDIAYPGLPGGLEGLTIVQLSDIHLGSMYGKQDRFRKAVDRINNLKPDLILFTGDMVNNFSEEAHGWEELFASMQARIGKYSILGNHDYGNYWTWTSEQERDDNMQRLYEIQQKMGFRLLLNECDTIRHNGETLALIGVENWGLPPFSGTGDLKKATAGMPLVSFKVLMSHNPTHWDAEVLNKTDIGLTLSGHTHAAQFGIKIGRFSWSPARYFYDRWMGLYRESGQALYVNRGLGYIGFPGRVGLRPEITLITLRSASGNDASL